MFGGACKQNKGDYSQNCMQNTIRRGWGKMGGTGEGEGGGKERAGGKVGRSAADEVERKADASARACRDRAQRESEQ